MASTKLNSLPSSAAQCLKPSAKADDTDGATNVANRPDAVPEVYQEAPPPDGGYGWVIVASCATLNGFTWGVTAVSLISKSNDNPESLIPALAVVWCLSHSLPVYSNISRR
jgi:hypothetical protein